MLSNRLGATPGEPLREESQPRNDWYDQAVGGHGGDGGAAVMGGLKSSETNARIHLDCP